MASLRRVDFVYSLISARFTARAPHTERNNETKV